MRRFVSILAMISVCATFALAQGGGAMKDKAKHGAEKAAKAEKTTLTGYIVDKMCADGHSDDLGEMAPGHTKSCALSEGCLKTGLGVVADGKWYAFDPKGTQKAAAILKKSKADKGAMYEVTGSLQGDTLVVSSIKELPAETHTM